MSKNGRAYTIAEIVEQATGRRRSNASDHIRLWKTACMEGIKPIAQYKYAKGSVCIWDETGAKKLIDALRVQV